MSKLKSQAILQVPIDRLNSYREIVENYYEIVTDYYYRYWGKSFHFAVFSGSETLNEALTTTERFIADVGGFKANMKILDVGCGVGGPALNIAEYSGACITGLNISRQQLKIARQTAKERGMYKRVEFVLADAMHMPFANNSFDAVYIFEAGCYMPNKAAFYNECARVLRPGGMFVGLDWFCAEDLTPQQNVKYIEPICRYHAVPNLIALSELAKDLTAAGLSVETIQDMAKVGNILRNWELLDNKIVQNIRGFLPWLIPPVLRMLTDGGYALLEGSRSGAFTIGHWQSYKPSITEVV